MKIFVLSEEVINRRKYITECPLSLSSETNRLKIPNSCFFHVKWRKPKNEETKARNQEILRKLGVYNYSIDSILPKNGIKENVEAVILVITRWNDTGSRSFLRNTIGHKIRKLQLLFVYGIPENATKNEIMMLREENESQKDMIMLSKCYK